MPTMPSDSEAIWVKAPTERSIDSLFTQLGHSSATVTSTDLLGLSARKILICLPQ